jgi:predicted aconitase
LISAAGARKSDGMKVALKVLSYFDDLAALPVEAQRRLYNAVADVDVTKLLTLTPYETRSAEDGMTL